jgi:endonuclease/exonuclease/phosphatase (EEP) superfamily protein YafD
LNGPVLVGGDANVTDLSEAYHVMTADLNDAWRETGYGFGHTFPGSSIPGSSRPRVAGYPVPKWLARIDYVLYSDHWVGLASRVARFDGVSDHRGVLTELSLK